MGTNISGLGIANAIGFKPRVDGGRRFLPPNIKSSLVSVISTYGKKNTDSDRDILKDLTGKGNDFKLFNFSFSEASGYGEYKTDFSKNWALEMAAITGNQIVTFNRGDYKAGVFFLKIPTSLKVNVASFTVDVDFKSSKEDAAPYYYYWDTTGKRNQIILVKGKNVLPVNYASNSAEGSIGSGFHDSFCDTVTIKQIPDFEGWLCTDGVDDIIESVKPISEMLEGSNEITVVSIIHQISIPAGRDSAVTNSLVFPGRTNYFANYSGESSVGKTGIYGYSSSSKGNAIINNVLGDKKDYNVYGVDKTIGDRFYVMSPNVLSQIAYAGGFIANKVLTTDEINQIIAYYNLDRPGQIIKPYLYCNIKKQGITNDNHAEFNDQLIDFVGGHNIQLNNIAWEGESGINSYPVVFGANKTWEAYAIYNFTGNINGNKLHITHIEHANNGFLFSYVKREGQILNKKEIPSFKIKISGLEGDSKLLYLYLKTENATGGSSLSVGNGVHELPKSFIPTESLQSNMWVGFTISPAQEGVSNFDCDITLEVLPTIENAICLDGISDFGKATGLPILKDYTVVADRELYNGKHTGAVVSKAYEPNNGSFYFESSVYVASFGSLNELAIRESRFMSYQSKYIYNGNPIQVGTGVDTDSMWLGTLRDGDYRFSKLALWSLMLFPYSLSEFLLERQLKKYKLGSLYPDNSFPFRPVVTANGGYNSISYYRESDGTSISIGSYIEKDSTVLISIRTNGIDEVLKVTVDGKEVELYSAGGNYYRYKFVVRNSYPKIDITIQEYVKYDDIVQPYPVIFVLQDKESGKELTYGNYVKVGDIIKVKSIIYYNQYLWSIHGYQIGDDSKIYSYNELINKDIVVTKPLSFGCIKKWLLSTAEPLFVYDPAIFTNNAIKTLGYLPDISGQNRHLKLYNFSYEGMSGKDGYPVVFGKNKTWTTLRAESDIVKYDINSNKLTIYKCNSNSALLYSIVYNNGTTYSVTIPSFKLKVTGIRQGRKILYRYISESNRNITSDLVIVKDGTYDIPQSYQIEPDESTPNSLVGFIVDDNNDANIILEILPDYKDSLYFNGITNTASVLNLDHGGKCLVTKINYKFNQETICIYDQRKNTLEENIKKFALLATQQSDIAYGNGLEGNTYINNVLNNYVKSSELENVEHVATLVSSVVTDSNTKAPLFGRNVSNQHYAQFAMYRTILLPEVPNAADLAILNKWCGLPTGYLPKPEYYWDVTGKSNSDTATRNTIKNLGTAKPVASTSDEDAYSLENKNVAYEGMSGYNGYPVVFGANKTWETYATYNFTSTINDNKLHITKVLNSNDLIFSYVKRNDELLNIKEIPSFKIKVTGLEGESKLLYFYLSEENAANITILTLENGVHEIPKSLIPTNALPNSTWIGFKITSIQEGVSSFDCDITLEILPDYYGLCLDGITNYIECANIPAFTDYTYILMRQILSNNIPNSVTMHKGIVKAYAGAFTADYVINNEEAYINKFAFHSFGATNIIYRNKVANKIIWANTTSVNGIAVSRGSNTDDESITIAKFENNYRRMVFYKLMLWSKSITNTYHINMLRNLINNGGIIDLNDSIFDQTSNE